MRSLVVLASLAFCLACPTVDGREGEGEGEGERDEPPCIIGDPDAQAEIVLIARVDVSGETATDVDVVDGLEVPLVLSPEGGHMVPIAVRARNVSCRVFVNVSATDPCTDTVIALEARPITLVEGDDAFGYPVPPQAAFPYQVFSNLPLCPGSLSSRDIDGQPHSILVRVDEVRRDGEAEARSYELTASITPICPAGDADCECECDAEFELGVSREEQCPTINDNDAGFGECPAE